MSYPHDPSSSISSLTEALDRHDQRRRAGRPIVSTLVGPVALAVRLWRHWSRSAGRPAVVVDTPDAECILSRWLDGVLGSRNLIAEAEEFIARKLHQPRTLLGLTGKTLHELQMMFERAALEGDGTSAGPLARRLLESRATGQLVSSETIAGWFSEGGLTAADRLARCWTAVADLLPPGGVPALLLVPGRLDDGASSADVAEADRMARRAAGLVTRVPSAAVGVALSADAFQQYLTETAESFSKAVLRESVLHAAGDSAEQIRQAVETRLGRPSGDLLPLFERLAHHGASAELVDRFAEALAWSETPHRATVSCESASSGENVGYLEGAAVPAAPESAARSAAEAFLFELLEHTPDLSGLFELNAAPGFSFGGRPAEIDLACLPLRIAVEIDGYYHFTDPDGYRRDRRKDVELQRQGYLVLRFLAEDVVARMEEVCESIRAAVRWRHEAPTDC